MIGFPRRLYKKKGRILWILPFVVSLKKTYTYLQQLSYWAGVLLAAAVPPAVFGVDR
jgi:hypothetical protein